ncbi:MAG: DUF2986 domain-containing protein [Shewanella sp.]|nr:DUF2986 domain-containing protein [Shewanella sp.]MCF1430520.1 DUF2986 domain-containing protein [Shewanella sp.]MCF1439582.1 DUF2986 domain-containing protein [Shewanella sp.]MCF1457431.1 DUF2986 domain-containing protein [Shewanella sp.]
MNKKQKLIKQMAKRAKARENKKEKPNPSSKVKPRYISKAERAKLEALAATQGNAAAEKHALPTSPEQAD